MIIKKWLWSHSAQVQIPASYLLCILAQYLTIPCFSFPVCKWGWYCKDILWVFLFMSTKWVLHVECVEQCLAQSSFLIMWVIIFAITAYYDGNCPGYGVRIAGSKSKFDYHIPDLWIWEMLFQLWSLFPIYKRWNICLMESLRGFSRKARGSSDKSHSSQGHTWWSHSDLGTNLRELCGSR